MQVLHGTDEVPASARGAALAIGNFDGVHRGHQALLKVAHDEAAKLRRPAGAILFEPHPREFFQPERPHFRLTPLPLKLELLERFGLDLAVVLRFDAALAALSADGFIDRVLVEKLAAAHVVIGYDFRFGKGRGGDPRDARAGGRRARLRRQRRGTGGGGRRGVLLRRHSRRAGAGRCPGRGADAGLVVAGVGQA